MGTYGERLGDMWTDVGEMGTDSDIWRQMGTNCDRWLQIWTDGKDVDREGQMGQMGTDGTDVDREGKMGTDGNRSDIWDQTDGDR